MRRALIVPLYFCYAIIALFGVLAMGIERLMAADLPQRRTGLYR